MQVEIWIESAQYSQDVVFGGIYFNKVGLCLFIIYKFIAMLSKITRGIQKGARPQVSNGSLPQSVASCIRLRLNQSHAHQFFLFVGEHSNCRSQMLQLK